MSSPSAAIISATDPMSSAAEAYRTLHASLVLMPTTRWGPDRRRTRQPQVVLVTSAAPATARPPRSPTSPPARGGGPHRARARLRLPPPQIHNYLGVDPRRGIADVLVGETAAPQERGPGDLLPGVSVAPSGTSLRSLGDVANAGRALVQEARSLADVVLIDTPPILATNDATELIPAADAVVVVARVGNTSVDGAKRTHRLLDRPRPPPPASW